VDTTNRRIRITHPFHPQSGRDFDLVCRRLSWGEDRVTYADGDGRLRSVSANLTDIDPVEQFRHVAAGNAAFHPLDLLALCDLLARLNSPTVVKPISPQCKEHSAASLDPRE
jgi:hypothetical protein